MVHTVSSTRSWIRSDGRAQEVHRSEHSRSNKCGRPAPRHQFGQGGKATVHRCFPKAVTGEGAEELTFRAEEVCSRRTLIDTTHVEAMRWGFPLVDADWYAFCQAIYQGIEGQTWETLFHYHCKDLHQAVGTKKLEENQNARAPRARKAVEDREEQLHDPVHRKDIQGRTQTRLYLREEHLKSPVAALAKALECLEAASVC